MPVPWRQLQLKLDDTVDAQWGERISLIPMKQSTYGGGNQPDNSRKIVKQTIGVFTMFGDRSIGLLGDRSGFPFIERASVEDMTLTIEKTKLDGFEPRVGDHVKMLDRDNWILEINRLAPGSSDRSKFVLIETAR